MTTNTANIQFHIQLGQRMTAYETFLSIQRSYVIIDKICNSGLVFRQILRMEQKISKDSTEIITNV